MTTSEEFRHFGKEMIDYVANYLEDIRSKDVIPSVVPGYLKNLVPKSAPEEPEPWKSLLDDIDKVIMPGVTHWHHPQFHGYFPTGNSYPSIVADILCDAIGCIGFNWMASPVCTELEMIMMDWLGKMLELPQEFLFESGLGGGGVIQGTASEATCAAMLTARSRMLKQGFAIEKLVAYASEESHSSVEKSGMLCGVTIRLLETDENFSLRGETLTQAIQRDHSLGLTPFMVISTLGTTSCCSFDNTSELGAICKASGLWLHIDAAYAGSSFICPEFRHLLNGIELSDSFNFNPHKWLLTNFDCSTLWVRNSSEWEGAFSTDPLYLRHSHQGFLPDYRHWHIPLGRRFRSLKLWFVIRSYGLSGLQNYIRTHVGYAKEFEALVLSDSRFEIPVKVTLGLVVFRLKGSNDVNEKLFARIVERRKIFLTPSNIKGVFILRFAVCSRYTLSSDIRFAWNEIQKAVE